MAITYNIVKSLQSAEVKCNPTFVLGTQTSDKTTITTPGKAMYFDLNHLVLIINQTMWLISIDFDFEYIKLINQYCSHVLSLEYKFDTVEEAQSNCSQIINCSGVSVMDCVESRNNINLCDNCEFQDLEDYCS